MGLAPERRPAVWSDHQTKSSNRSRLKMHITGMNHAVLYVRDARSHQHFYEDLFGFTTSIEDSAGRYVFMRAPKSMNHHDVAFFTVGKEAAASSAGRGAVGMYHLAWEVPTLGALTEVRDRLDEAGCLVGASDHGVNKSLYATDPDGLEFEVMWLVPREFWGEAETVAVIEPLDLKAEVNRFGSERQGGG